MPEQAYPDWQSAAVVQEARQVPDVESQTSGEQEVVVSAWQDPVPLQTRWLLDRLPLAHEAPAQTVPADQTWQDRAPEHAPVLPHVDGNWVEHSSAGSVPTGMASQ